ncbi:MAG: Co2+/Mg2+ efflux protein ApaG [Candidatus Melainabacteria bacterium]|jgi:ApaG protein
MKSKTIDSENLISQDSKEKRPNLNSIYSGLFSVKSTPKFIAKESDPRANKFVFEYTIEILNKAETPATLTERRWVIIDGNGNREEVEGPGVVGETPLIQPGESFSYTSFCPLRTHWGTMEGSYKMQTQDGEFFDIEIPRFFLVSSQKR